MTPDWRGIYPAVTTQFHPDHRLDIEATERVVDNLVRDGVHGLVMLGTCGENTSLSADEKLEVIRAACRASDGRVPVITGVAEYTTDTACRFVRDVEAIGANGIMILPAMVYKADRRELVTHIRSVAEACSLPAMIYNNPASYGIDIDPETLIELSATPNIVAVKESSEDPRRINDLINLAPEALAIMAGVDDVALECMTVGAIGWVSGFANVYPRESVAIYDHLQAGRLEPAVRIYRWMMDSLHMDTHPKLVQMIKLAEQIAGRGSETVRPPRLPLVGDERDRVSAIIEKALAARPSV
ncbi:dihydrodipicolinate synthase family protein [Spiribacter vilamensis]|uniref:4-hydroxy-tetrahydrodipicolinate synthase n=1 Tax=Spiribacter vilamensis TaxID=531306 RepID=A0A4Q8D1U1_9GAMM|nr:dihydrodipicolinate synthase family protein [Spiribacter vilamensis]RZU99356.1 4-hydroxy-tetrahydrodipicolinate synthase [Spiribacter vilamensis]TVO61662.1 dihydrodipicolinate synthase family protein [Spiribacter vilamensis]